MEDDDMTNNDDDIEPDDVIELGENGRQLLERLRKSGAVNEAETETIPEDVLIMEVLDRMTGESAGRVDATVKKLARLLGSFESAIRALRSGEVRLIDATLH
jgi:hypothetical protein